MRPHIVTYNLYSQSAKLIQKHLSNILGYKVYRGTTPKDNRFNLVWGLPNGIGANKLRTFEVFREHGVQSPPFTTSRATAEQWAMQHPIVARKLLRSSGGKGAVYIERGGAVIDAPLYVKYIPKKKEFRVHVHNGNIILVQQKRKRSGTSPDTKIRSHENDWVFCINNITEPEDLRSVALAACAAVGHGGGVDIIWNQLQNRCYALEVNSAPGLSDSSALTYANVFVQELQNG